MKNLLLILTCFFTISLISQIKINNKEVKVNFVFVKDKTEGSVSGFEAEIKFDIQDLSNSYFKGKVDVNTLSTGNKMRDKHLKSDDFFESDEYPEMTFESKSIKIVDSGYAVTGDLKIKETTREVVFFMIFKEESFVCKSTIYSGDFNVMKKKTREKSQVDIEVFIPIEK